jgi:hypothetical protein
VFGVPASGRISQATEEKECGLSTRPMPKALWRFSANSTKTVFGVKGDTGHAIDLLALGSQSTKLPPRPRTVGVRGACGCYLRD